jgi:MFS family permease
MTFRTRFVLLAFGWTVLCGCLAVGLPQVYASRLPDPVASHWGTRGLPDDSMPLWALTAIAVGLFAAVAVPSLGVAIQGAALRRWRSRAWVVAALAWAGVFTVALLTLTIWANLDVTDWRAARPVSWQVVLVIGASFAAAGVGLLVGRRRPDDPPDRSGRTQSVLRPKPGERVTWVSSATNTTLLGTAFVLLAASGIMAVLLVAWLPGPWWFVAGTLAATGLAGLLVTTLGISVDDADRGAALLNGLLSHTA